MHPMPWRGQPLQTDKAKVFRIGQVQKMRRVWLDSEAVEKCGVVGSIAHKKHCRPDGIESGIKPGVK